MKAHKKHITKAFKAMVNDKTYIKKQLAEGKNIDNTKLKGGMIVKVSL